MVKRQTYKRGVSIDQETATLLMAWYRADFLPTYLPLSDVGSRYLALVADQEARLASEQKISPIPLMWVAMAQVIGLTVEMETGRIVSGPYHKPGVVAEGKENE